MTTTNDSATVTPFLMFTGKAEEAMKFYVSLFANASIDTVTRWGAEEQGGVKGSIKLAIFSLNGQKVMCTDSLPVHSFTFTPATSLYVTCSNNEDEFNRYCDSLAKDGKYLMPPGNYGFSSMFSWVEDRFGVSWQINFP